MITINNKKFAETKKEFIDSLFETEGTCVGYAKRFKHRIILENSNKERIGTINSYGVICKATKEDGKYWYSYGEIDELGEMSYFEKNTVADKLCVSFCSSGGERVYIYK